MIKNNFKKVCAVLMAVIMILSFAACGKKPENQGNEPVTEVKDTLTFAIMTDPEGLDPQKTSATSTFFVTTNIFETLIVVDENWNVQPRLATDWKVADDCMSVTFTLRDDVKFHDGSKMTAEDVKFSIERLHESDSPKKKYYANITGCTIDGNKITFTCDKPDAVLLTSFAYPWSVIVPKAVVEKDPESLKTKPVGTGAYKFVNWTPQQNLNLTINEDYYGTAANIKNVEYTIVPDATTAMVGVMSGSVDIVDITGSPVESIKDNPAVSLYTYGVNSVTILGMNLDNEYLKNEKVRQAMAAAIDKDEIIRSCNQGFGDKVGSYLPTLAEEYIDTNNVIPFNLENAKKLLAEAGYPDGFEIGLTLPKSYPIYANSGQVIADQLAKIGIKCNIEIVEWADWMQNVYTDKKYDMTVMANSGRLSAYDFISRFNSASGDYISYKTGEADDILNALKSELNGAKRKELIQDFQKLVAEKVPVVPIVVPLRVFANNSKLQGFVMYPSETTELKNVSFAK